MILLDALVLVIFILTIISFVGLLFIGLAPYIDLINDYFSDER